MKYMLLIPAVVLAACIALYAWAAYAMRPAKGQEDWEEMYT